MGKKPGRLLAEIRQTRPFGSRTAEGVVALMRTTDLVRRRLARTIERHGITLQQYNVLRILRGAGGGGLPTLEIGGRMIESAPGVTRLLDRLEAKGLVRRARCARDRRQVLCSIQPRGLELLGRLDEPVGTAGADALGTLPRRRLGELILTLDEIRSALERGDVTAKRIASKGEPT